MAKKPPVDDTPTEPARRAEESPEVLAIESIEIESTEKPETAKPAGLKSETHHNMFVKFAQWYWRFKIYTLPVTVIVILGVLLAIPVTRYAMTSWFWKESITVVARDASTQRPISEATVKIAGMTVKTDSIGLAKVEGIPVGPHELVVEKAFYKTISQQITVEWFSRGKQYEQAATATGRQVQVRVDDRVSGGVLANALVSVTKDNQARTNDKGLATIIIPADKQEVPVSVSADNYLATTAIAKQTGENIAALVPAGKMYFLSKQSGKIDVVKTNYDGSERKVVVQGTGSESDATTSLLASRDWKYLVLHAQRDGTKPEGLYLINTQTDTMELFDEAKDASFTLVGWSGQRFIYQVTRDKIPEWQPKREALKSMNAADKKLTTIDETQAQGDGYPNGAYERMNGFYILDGVVTYLKRWFGAAVAGKVSNIMSVQPDGAQKKSLKTYAADKLSSLEAKLYTPQEIHYQAYNTDGLRENVMTIKGAIVPVPPAQQKFDLAYPTYLISPDGARSFWAESRDGKNVLLVGDNDAKNKEELITKSEFTAYGWMTDIYLLLQKGNSELFITTKEQLKAGVAPLKVSDYHKPTIGFPGYGYGYGGQ